MKEWKKRGRCTGWSSYVEEQTGMSIDEFTHPAKNYKIYDMGLIANRLKFAAQTHEKVCVISDYDADGVTSTICMVKILRALGITFSLIVPRRFSEGYGLKEKVCERALATNADIYLTIDNGITAVDQIKRLKDLGKYVIVMDHHMHQEEIPAADIIVDPEAFPYSADYDGYCGAGLAYKLAQSLFPNNEHLLKEISIFAAIGTICDVVPLKHDNRKIVMEGMENLLNPEFTTCGTSRLVRNTIKTEMQYMSSSDIAYYVGPCINAPGRLLDNGAEKSVQALIKDSIKAESLVDEVIALNQTRSELTKKAENEFNPELFLNANYILYFATGMPEGLLGVLAGRLCEEYKKPTIVLAEGEGDIYKGSCRSIPEVNLVEVLETCKDLFTSFGGHSQAAGISVKRDNLNKLKVAFDLAFPEVTVDDSVFYDFEIGSTTAELEEFLRVSDLMEPFGEGNPEPTVLIKNIKIGKMIGTNFEKCKYMGQTKEHLSIMTDQGYKMVLFNMGKDITPDDINKWNYVDIIGKVKRNWYKGNAYRQVIVQAIRRTS